MKFLLLSLSLLLCCGKMYAADTDCTLIYGVRSDPYKPYEWFDETGEPHGLNIDLLKVLSKQAGCDYKIVSGVRTTLLHMLENNEVTMISITPDSNTDKFALYLHQPVLIYRYVVNRANDPLIKDENDWYGKTVLVMRDSHSDYYMTSVQEKYDLTILRYDTSTELPSVLSDGIGDFIVANYYNIMNYEDKYALKINGFPMQPSLYGFAVNKNNTDIYARLEKAMLELRSNGTYFEIMQEWSRAQERPPWYKYVLPAIGGLLSVVILILLWNTVLHRQVKKKTSSLNDLSELLQMLLNVLPEQICLVNRDKHIVWSNTKYKNEWLSSDFIKTEMDRAIEDNIPFEHQVLLDNAETWLITGTLLEQEENPLLLIAANITETVRMRDQSLMTDRMAALGNMAANIAHEINNPSALIIHNVDLIKKLSQDIDYFIEAHSNDDGDDFMGMAWNEARKEKDSAIGIVWENILRIKNTVEELKEYSKKRSAIYKKVDMRDCVNTAVRFSSFFVKSFTRNFIVRIEEPVPLIYGYQQHIEQVIINLIQNACYALTNNEQSISCSLYGSEDGKYAVLTVTDEGCGMSESVKQQACDAFFTTRENGTGLGLSIMATIVKEHYGYYTIESEENKKTEISIYLPGTSI